jgi:hypothetical protein
MKDFCSAKAMDPIIQTTTCLELILGLSATIVKGTCKLREVPQKIKEIEQTVQSLALTHKDYDEV